MQINKDNLTIVIVTLKSDKVIHRCLKSIDPQIKKIIIENSSNEKFIKDLKEKYNNIDCYLAGKNLGMGAGNNIGIKKSNTKFVMILNPDTILNYDTLDKIFDISNNLDFAIISPVNSDKNFPNYKIKDKKFRGNLTSDLFEVDRVDGYAMILDKSKFSGNFFDEEIFMYLENDDLCIRMKKLKEKIFVYNKSLISHLGASAVDQKYVSEIELSRNWHWNWSKFYFRKKHYGFSNAFFFSFPTFIKSLIKSFFYLIIKNKLKSKLYFLRSSGIFNAFLNKESWYRPKID